MPCRLYTGEAYAIRYETQAYDEWMLSFFLNGHMEDYLVLYDSNDNFKGLVTYAGFIKNGLGGVSAIKYFWGMAFGKTHGKH